MKKLLWLLMLLPSVSFAQSSLLTIPGLADAVTTALKSSKAVGLIDLNQTIGAGTFIPVRTLHDAEGIQYLEAGFGGVIKQGENAKPLIIAQANLSAILRKIESYNGWYVAHVSKVTLPDFWFGPYIQPPLPGYAFTWKTNVGGAISIGF